jgi:hypothetical protein
VFAKSFCQGVKQEEQMKSVKTILSATALVLSVSFGCAQLANAQAAPAANPTNVTGKVVSFKGAELIVASPSDVKVSVGDKTVIRSEVPIQFSEITSGMYVGATASKQPDGTFLASQINIFSEDQRGTGEGHRPLGNATMTNANVERVEDITVKDVKGRMLKLKYKDGEVDVLVPPDISINKRVVSDRSAVKPGSEVSVTVAPEADGSLSARQITVRAPKR